MGQTLRITELLRNFSNYINRVTYKRETFLLMRGNLKVAELKPAPIGCKVRDLLQNLKQFPFLDSSDVDSFAADLKKIRTQDKKQKLKDPWQ